MSQARTKQTFQISHHKNFGPFRDAQLTFLISKQFSFGRMHHQHTHTKKAYTHGFYDCALLSPISPLPHHRDSWPAPRVESELTAVPHDTLWPSRATLSTPVLYLKTTHLLRMCSGTGPKIAPMASTGLPARPSCIASATRPFSPSMSLAGSYAFSSVIIVRTAASLAGAAQAPVRRRNLRMVRPPGSALGMTTSICYRTRRVLLLLFLGTSPLQACTSQPARWPL